MKKTHSKETNKNHGENPDMPMDFKILTANQKSKTFIKIFVIFQKEV
jgi:hypothetical protein